MTVGNTGTEIHKAYGQKIRAPTSERLLQATWAFERGHLRLRVKCDVAIVTPIRDDACEETPVIAELAIQHIKLEAEHNF